MDATSSCEYEEAVQEVYNGWHPKPAEDEAGIEIEGLELSVHSCQPNLEPHFSERAEVSLDFKEGETSLDIRRTSAEDQPLWGSRRLSQGERKIPEIVNTDCITWNRVISRF